MLSCIPLLLALLRHRNESTYFTLLIISSAAQLIPLILNMVHRHSLSRWLVCVIPVVSNVVLSVSRKMLYPDSIRILSYLDVRFFLVGCAVIPILVFQSRERKLLVSALAISLVMLMLLDPIFNFMHVGYEDLVGNGDQYYFRANFFSITAYVFILFSFLFEKINSDKAQLENEVLISFLNKANQEIANQNSEIKSKSGELLARQDQLVLANKLIEEQKEALLQIQSGLKTELVERNKELLRANEELSKYNHELQQFSYTVSHNLRGPLARLLGLTNLMEKDLADLARPQFELVKLVTQSARELDEVIRDLGKIIDIRNDIFRIREKVFFQEEWRSLLRTLTPFVHPDMHLETDFREAPLVFTVRPILASVLYNLTTNAIKYRSPDRPLKLKIKTSRIDEGVMLEVTDNGLGIDLTHNDHNVFGLYKRFHTHTDGKGLGLYLVKLQVESLGGNVELQSQLNIGTVFKVVFKEPARAEGQVVYESEYGSVLYNAQTNCTSVRWNKAVPSDEYRQVLSKCVDVVKNYHTPFWISDITDRGMINKEDQEWLIAKKMPEAVRYGLRKVATVYRDEQFNQQYFGHLESIANGYGIEIKFFNERAQAEAWVQSLVEAPVA